MTLLQSGLTGHAATPPPPPTVPTIIVSPNPVAPSKRLDVAGSGFSPNSGVSVKMDGASYIAKAYPAHDGSFLFAIPTPATTGTHTVTASVGGSTVASATVVVGAVAPPPPPPPPPSAGPVISGVAVTGVTQTAADVGWTLSEPSTGQVEYGLTPAYGLLSTPETSFSFSAHKQHLSGLPAATTYHFRVKSTNKAGGTSYSPDGTFTTAP